MDELISRITEMAQANLPASIAAGLALLYLLYRKPKLVLGLMVLGGIIITLYFLISDASTAGGKQKQKMFRTY